MEILFLSMILPAVTAQTFPTSTTAISSSSTTAQSTFSTFPAASSSFPKTSALPVFLTSNPSIFFTNAATLSPSSMDFTVTVETIDMGIAMAIRNKEKLPELLVELLQNTTNQEKEEFVTFLNKLHNGQITGQLNTLEDLVRLTAEEAPMFGEKLKTLYEDYMRRTGMLTEQARQFLEKWELRWFQAMHKIKINKGTFFKEILQMIPEILGETKNFSSHTWITFEEQFPELYSVWSTNEQKLEQYFGIMPKLPINEVVTKGPESSRSFTETNLPNSSPFET